MAEIDSEDPDPGKQRNLAAAAKAAITRLNASDKIEKANSSTAPKSPIADESKGRIAVRNSMINRNDPSAQERLIGTRDIVSINFFELGLQAARAVCRIKTSGLRAGPPDYATGFLATPNLLVTNHHVLPDPEIASWSFAEFEYELDRNFVARGSRSFALTPGVVFYTSAELDFTIVAVGPVAHDGTPATDFGVLPLIPMSGKGLVGEHVSIIQHPEGGTKQVVVRENRIIALDEGKFPGINPAFMYYEADTERGSSGSPIFNDQWDLVAVHHMAIVDVDAEGRELNRRNKVWTPADGEDAKKWIANEGIRISAICADLRANAPFNADAAKILALLAAEPHGSGRPVVVNPAEQQKWQTIPNTAEGPAFETTRFSDPKFRDSMGYDEKFLGNGLTVPLPKTGATFRGTLAINLETKGTVFDYTHFSLAMHAERRLATWTAVNIDGAVVKSAASPSWRKDKRLLDTQQTLAKAYGPVPGKSIQIDRGHLVRRLDPVWGPQDVADRAGADTFHYTNAAPQEHVYNSEIWGNLEDFVLARAEERDHKVTVMTGPVLRPDDKFYGTDIETGPWQVPWSFWKIAIFRRPDDSLSVTGFVIEQIEKIAPLFEAAKYNPYSVEEARVFQRPIKVIEEMTGLDFGKLRTMDRMGAVESTSAASARPIRDKGDIAF